MISVVVREILRFLNMIYTCCVPACKVWLQIWQNFGKNYLKFPTDSVLQNKWFIQFHGKTGV